MKLTPKQQEIVELMAAGLKPGEIQRRLGISAYVYGSRRDRAMAAFGAQNDLQFGVLVERYQLVPAAPRNSSARETAARGRLLQ